MSKKLKKKDKILEETNYLMTIKVSQDFSKAILEITKEFESLLRLYPKHIIEMDNVFCHLKMTIKPKEK